jgi:uncharacterized protein (TIGR02453 family)
MASLWTQAMMRAAHPLRTIIDPSVRRHAMRTAAKSGQPAADTPPFVGFPREAFAFFARLAKNNKREWFLPRKEEYERICQAPLKALAAALDPPLGSSTLTRIYRDIRFSKDKSPYHTHVSTIVRGNFLSLSSKGLYVGTGMYMPQPATLRKMREAIHADRSGAALTSLVTSLRRKGYTVASHEVVMSAPRGYSSDHPRLELLSMKDIHAGRTLKPSELSSADAVAKVQRVCRDIAPLREWLRRYVGPSSCE